MHFYADLPDFADCCAQLSDAESVDTAVVFVHGFMGDRTKTWTDFQTLVDDIPHEIPHWERSDLYFYSYRSVGDPIQFNAKRLVEFLQHVFPQPNSEWFERLLDQHPGKPLLDLERICLRESPYRYSDLVLVGHSEGGLILRSAIAEVAKGFHQTMERYQQTPTPSPSAIRAQTRAEGKEKNWTEMQIKAAIVHRITSAGTHVGKPHPPAIAQGRLRLFAPAVMGARPSRLLGWLDASLIGKALRPFFRASVAYNDMQPESQLVTAIRDRTEEYSSRYPTLTALRAKILWGRKENVLTAGDYRDDDYEFAEGHDHVSVCKPNPEYLRPLEFVRE